MAEFDFVSIYPNIHVKGKQIVLTLLTVIVASWNHNNKVSELEHMYHSWTKRTGMVPLFLRTILERRLEYIKKKTYTNFYLN